MSNHFIKRARVLLSILVIKNVFRGGRQVKYFVNQPIFVMQGTKIPLDSKLFRFIIKFIFVSKNMKITSQTQWFHNGCALFIKFNDAQCVKFRQNIERAF